MMINNNQELVEEPGNLKSYLIIWIGQLISLLGSGVVQFSIIWWLTLKTESAFVLALATFVGLVPMVILSPLSGVLADRWSRKSIILISDFFQAIATLGLIILFWVNIVKIWHVLALLAVRGVFQAFHMPASVAIVPQLVPKSQISRINGLTSIFNNLIFIISPAIGALLLEFFTVGGILWLDVITFLIAVGTLVIVTIPPIVRKAELETINISFKAQFIEGLSYLKTSGLMPLVVVFTIGNILINPLFSLMPLFVKEIHLGGALELAFIFGLFQAGNFGSSMLIALKNFTPSIKTLTVSLATTFFGMLLIALAPSETFAIIGVGTLIIGFSVGIIDVGIISYLQIFIPPEMQGRIMSVTFTLVKSILPLALLAVGGIAEIVGMRLLFLLSPILGFGLVLYSLTLSNIALPEKQSVPSSTLQPS